MCLPTSGVQSNPPLNIVQLNVFKVIIFQEKELLPSGDSPELSPGNNNPTEFITLVLVGLPFRNQIGRAEVANED